jgi:hypothetical protein
MRRRWAMMERGAMMRISRLAGHDGAGRATSRSTTDGESDVAIHHDGAGKPPRSLGCDRSVGGSASFGAGKPPLSVTFYICVCCSDHEPRRRGEPRSAANVDLLVSATLQIGDNAPLRRGLPPPNVQSPAVWPITAQRAAGLASADDKERRPDLSPRRGSRRRDQRRPQRRRDHLYD